MLAGMQESMRAMHEEMARNQLQSMQALAALTTRVSQVCD